MLYMSIRAHFFGKNYDAVKSNGRISVRGNNAFENRRDKSLFNALAKRFETSQQAASYFVANFAQGNTYCIMDHDRGFDFYNTWQRKRQSLTKTFKDDLATIERTGLSMEALIDSADVPKLLILEKNGKVNIETLCIMNIFDKFVDTWEKRQPLWKDDYLRIAKLASFVKIDEAKFNRLYQEFKEELKEHHETMA